MKRFLVILTFIVISIPAFSQSKWTPTIVEGEKAYSITSTDAKGNKCNILVFYGDYGLKEAWFTMPGKIVEHEEILEPLGERFVTHTTIYSLKMANQQQSNFTEGTGHVSAMTNWTKNLSL